MADSYFSGNQYVGGLCGYNNGGQLTNCASSSTVTGSGNNVSGVCGYNNGSITGCTNSGTVTGNQYVGGVCGQNNGTNNSITNCTNTGSVTGTITNMYGYVGGVCGWNNSSITNCTNSGTVTGAGGRVGGVCGQNEDTNSSITNCTNTGTVNGQNWDVGGVCGRNNGSLTNCTNTNTGTVTSTNDEVGGVSGANYQGTIANCTNSGTVKGGARVGGVCGWSYGGTITNCTNTNTVIGSSNSVGGVCGNNTSTITNCYYDSTVYQDGSAVGTGSSATDTEGKTTEQFKSGEVTWLLNGSKATTAEGETLAWFQNLDNGEVVDTYPVLDNEHGTVYKNGDIYSNSPAKSKVAGHSLILDGSIGVNFFLELTDTVLQDQGAVVQFTLPNGAVSELSVYGKTPDTTTVPGKTYYKFTAHVAAKEMADVITMQVYDGTGAALLEQAHTYTVKEYADYMMEHLDVEAYQEASAMIKGMINYGSYAQVYFEHHANALANADLPENADPLAGITADTLAGFARTDVQTNNLVTLAGADLILESETTLRLYFTVNSTGTLTYTQNDKTLEAKTSDEYTYVEIDNINSTNLDTTYTVTVSNGSESCAMTYCPMTYAYNVLSRETTEVRTEALKNLIKALRLYNVESDRYYTKA